jgi:F-type H+-transporting ATPase subunit b
MTVAPMFSDWCPRRLGSALALLVALAAGSVAAGADEAPGNKHEADSHDVAAGGSDHKPAAGAETDLHPAEHKSKYDDPPLTFDLTLFVSTLLVFLTLLLLGTQLAWKPLIEGLDSREARINQAYAAAKQARVAVEQCSREYEARLAATTDEVKAIVAAARQDAEKARADVVAAATTEALALQERAIDEIMRAKEQALTELNSAVEQQTNIATEHILGYHLAGR